MTIKPTAFISELCFSGGNSFHINKNEKIILVGPNNSGKSQSLREIISICHTGNTEHTFVVKGLNLSKDGTEKDLKDFLNNNAKYIDGKYRYKNWQIDERQISFWNQDYLQHNLLSGFIKNIAANDRLAICEQQNSIAPNEQKSKPQHVLYEDDSLMNKISDLFKRAFGKELMFNYRGGSKIPIHVGEIPEIVGFNDRVSNEYVEKVEENPLLDKQGDGMKSYAGILFESIVSDLDITLIDEPEAFLHPPQMRKLGETLASEVKGQLIVATHSSDILRGFLEGTQGDVRILRISREEDSNIVAEASGETIKDLWEKPVLRYSNALEGIFHEQTIICEDDSDCRLINSVADHLELTSGETWLDTAYVPTGGKHGIPKIAEVLRKIGVPTKAVFDIDFLSEKSLVEETVKAFGGEWAEIEPLWLRVNAAVSKGITPKTASEIKSNVVSIIEKSGEEDLPKSAIRAALKDGTSWSIVKNYGEIGIPKGMAQKDYKSLRESLENIGIYLVPVGEIESFCPEIGSHGPKFITKLLSTIPLDDERLSELRSFVGKVHRGQHSILNNNPIIVNESQE